MAVDTENERIERLADDLLGLRVDGQDKPGRAIARGWAGWLKARRKLGCVEAVILEMAERQEAFLPLLSAFVSQKVRMDDAVTALSALSGEGLKCAAGKLEVALRAFQPPEAAPMLRESQDKDLWTWLKESERKVAALEQAVYYP